MHLKHDWNANPMQQVWECSGCQASVTGVQVNGWPYGVVHSPVAGVILDEIWERYTTTGYLGYILVNPKEDKINWRVRYTLRGSQSEED